MQQETATGSFITFLSDEQEAEITLESLQYLSKDDIKEAIPPIGLRARFREKLFSWRKSKHGIDDETLSDSIASKVISWLHNQPNLGSASTSTPMCSFSDPTGGCKLSKTLKLVLQETVKGKAITDFYEKYGYLIESFRTDLINLILENIFAHNAYLSPKDLLLIIEEILKNFPNEIKEYHLIPRNKKRNPGGKLWDKYINQRGKRARSQVNFKDNLVTTGSITPSGANTEIDEPILLSLKVSLSRDFSDSDAVKDKWQRTFLLRQKELRTSIINYEFIKIWPLYCYARSHELIDIDFELLYPNKSHLLLTKRNEFLKNIKSFYSSQVKDKKSKEVLVNSKDIRNESNFV